MAAYYSLNCVTLGYVTYYLGSIGLGDLFISIIVAIACALGGILQIVVGRVVDRIQRWNWKNVLIIFGSIVLLLNLSRIFIQATSWQWISYGSVMVFQMIMMPMVNLAGFDYSSKGIPVNFGIIRGVGSAAFAGASFIIGKLTVRFGSGSILEISAVLAALLIVVVLIMPLPAGEAVQGSGTQADTAQADASKKISIIAFIKKYPEFFIMVTGVAFLLVYHNLLNTFFIRVVENVGGDSDSLGIALGIAAIAELPILFLYSKINGKLIKSSRILIIISCVFFVVRSILYVFAFSVMMVYLIQLLQSVSFGLMVAAKATYADETMEISDKATGQSLMTFTDAFGAVVGTFAGGLLLNHGGVIFMLWGGVIIAVIGTLITLTTLAQKYLNRA